MEIEGIESPEMPECNAVYMIGYLSEVGPMQEGGPITHGEIESWQRNTGIDLDAWEARTLRMISAEYTSWNYRAADPLEPSPWVPEDVSEVNREASAKNIGNIFKSRVTK